MAISTYSELQAEVAAWLHRSNLTDRIPAFIQLAEERMQKHLRAFEMVSSESIAVTSGVATASLPTGFIKMRALRVDNDKGGKVLTYRPAAGLRDIEPNATTPQFYSYENGLLLLSPTPSASVTLIADCYAMPTALSDSNTTNAILTNYPSIYLQGALAEGYSYLRNMEKMNEANALFERAIKEANKASRDLTKSGVSAPLTGFKRRIP